MQKSFEQFNEFLVKLEQLSLNISFPQIEKDIILEKLRKIYVSVQNAQCIEASEQSVQSEKYEVYQGLDDDVDLFFDTDHESYNSTANVSDAKLCDQPGGEQGEPQIEQENEEAKLAEQMRRQAQEEQQKREAENRRKLEEETKLAEERRRQAEAEQRRREEETKRKLEEEAKLAEERRRQAEAEQRQREEEAKRKLEEEKKLAEERRRQAENEQKNNADLAALKAQEEAALNQSSPIDKQKFEEQSLFNGHRDVVETSNEDDILQFAPKQMPSSNSDVNRLQTQVPHRSLNDLFNEQMEDRSLSAQFQKAKVTDLTKAISINDKFTFIKELFNNKGEEFSAAITSLNQCASMDEAVHCLESLKQKFYWDSTSTAYLSLCDLVRRKYN